MDKEDAILRLNIPTSRGDSVKELLVTTSFSLGEARARIANDMSRLDGARVGALVEVGEHKGTKDVVIVFYDFAVFRWITEAQAREWMPRPRVRVVSGGQNLQEAILGLQ